MRVRAFFAGCARDDTPKDRRAERRSAALTRLSTLELAVRTDAMRAFSFTKRRTGANSKVFYIPLLHFVFCILIYLRVIHTCEHKNICAHI